MSESKIPPVFTELNGAPENNRIDASKIPPAIRLVALEIAIKELGQREEPYGSNAGPRVEEYLRSVGLGPGYSWCQAFVFWCYQQAADKLKQHNPVYHTAGVLACWNHTAVNFRITQEEAIKHPDLILPGYQFILDYGHGNGHTGIIERVEGKILHTIEGNSNDDGSREGYEVVRHKRDITNQLFKGIVSY